MSAIISLTSSITGISYQHFLKKELKVIEEPLEKIDFNQIPSSCIWRFDDLSLAVSKWVSPKRTRSYPYERIYNTLSHSKKITIIPIIKDEGKNGDRDFIQWDTICLMSLLDVYIIFSYYNDAEINSKGTKITKQKLSNDNIKSSILSLGNYYSSALHWNLKEIDKIPEIIDKIKTSYKRISDKLSVEMHSEKGLDTFSRKFKTEKDGFLQTIQFRQDSRKKAQQAQRRETLTIQPKENLSQRPKASITITNYLGGEYYFTVDEIKIEGDYIYLIEAKHSEQSLLPSIGDIKDGLLKMILYTQLTDVLMGGNKYQVIPCLKLTSKKLVSSYYSSSKEYSLKTFITENKVKSSQAKMVQNLINESFKNEFQVFIERIE